LTIGDGISFVDQGAQAPRSISASFVQLTRILIWVVELGGNLGDEGQCLAWKRAAASSNSARPLVGALR
jgi:hypothetical protein